jgi:hypothetical protein
MGTGPAAGDHPSALGPGSADVPNGVAKAFTMEPP